MLLYKERSQQNKNRLLHNTGNVLFTVILITAIIGIFLLSLIKMFSVDYNWFQLKKEKFIAQSIAESGIADGLYRWKNNFDWQAVSSNNRKFLEVKYGENKYILKTGQLRYPDMIRIESEGIYKNISAAVSQDFRIITPFIYAIYSQESLDIGSGSRITGSVFSNSIITIKENADIKGNILSGKFVKNYGNVTGEIFEELSNGELKKTYDIDDIFSEILYQVSEQESVLSVFEGKINNKNISDKIIICNSDIIIVNCQLKNVTLLVKGNIIFKGNNLISAPENYPAVFSSDLITIEKARISIKGFVCCTGFRSSLGSDLKLKGTLLSNTIELNGKVLINQNKDLYSQSIIGFSKKVIKSNWSTR